MPHDHTEPRILHRLRYAVDWQFIRGSSMVSIGITVGRIIGFAFSFLLARTLTVDDFGFVQYTITLAKLIAIGTIPFSQQVIAWFISRYQKDDDQLQSAIINSTLMLLGLFAITIVVSLPILIALERLSLAVYVIFAGLTAFFTYEGLSRGFFASGKLLTVYLGSNILQLIAVAAVISVMGPASATPALLIYGLSYFLPIIVLEAIKPFRLVFNVRRINQSMLRDMLKFAAPVWGSHILFTLTIAADILLLERYWDEATIGVYALTKTIVMAFSFFPQGLTLILMPRTRPRTMSALCFWQTAHPKQAPMMMTPMRRWRPSFSGGAMANQKRWCTVASVRSSKVMTGASSSGLSRRLLCTLKGMSSWGWGTAYSRQS